MISVNILLVEDEDDSAELIRETLDLELHNVGIIAEWISMPDAISARKVIREGNSIGVAIVDLYLGRPQERDGAMVIEEMRIHNDEAYILAATGHPDWLPGFRDDFGRLANHVIDKDELRESGRWSWRNLARDIKEHLIYIGRLDVGQMIYDHEDPGIVSILEDVGRVLIRPGGQQEGARALRVLASRCLGDLVSEEADMRLGCLSAPRSDVSVCRLDVSESGSPNLSFIMQFGLGRRALEKQILANRKVGKILGQQSLMSIVGELGSHESGYHALAARVANRTASLREWLLGEATAGQAATAAEVLLLEQLEPLYREDGRRQVETAAWMQLSAGRRVRARASVLRYGDVVGDSRAGARGDSEDVMQRLMRFIDGVELEVESLSHLRRQGTHVRVFGNLRSDNILVQPGTHPRLVLMDASFYKQDHWSSDNARLLVDLLLRVRHPGLESMLWTSMHDLDDTVNMLCPYCKMDTVQVIGFNVTPTEAFIEQAVELLPLSTHMQELGISQDDWHWEWHIALARELLRQAAYKDLTPPRACLAIVSAAEHLRIANELV
jgi:hypothetical protein